MDESRYLALIHTEIDGELEAGGRSELAHRLLADPDARALRDGLRQVCALLDAVEDVEPPSGLPVRILDALPPAGAPLKRARSLAPSWRYAALIAGVLTAAAIVFETGIGPSPATTELAGTIAADRGRVTLDAVRLDNGPVEGRVSLYRDAAGLGVTFQLAASAPVDVLVSSQGHTQSVNGLGAGGSAAGAGTSVALPGLGGGEARTVDLTFLMSGREVQRATLTLPDNRQGRSSASRTNFLPGSR